MTEIICGINPVQEVIRAGKRRVKKIYILANKKENSISDLLNLARKNNIKVEECQKNRLDNLSPVEKHQGVVAEVDPYQYLPVEELIEKSKAGDKPPFLVILDQVSDPHNLGAIIRTASLCGVDGLIIPKDNAASVGATVVKSSAGATEHLSIARVTNIARTINLLKENNIWVYGLDGEAAQDLYKHDLKGAIAIVIGAEGTGMRRLVKEECDNLLKIPMFSKIESYNASVAGAIVMAEIMRQRLA